MFSDVAMTNLYWEAYSYMTHMLLSLLCSRKHFVYAHWFGAGLICGVLISIYTQMTN